MGETYIPLIIHKPGGDTLPQRISPTINDQTDLAPTIIDLLELPKPDSWEGTSVFQDSLSGPVYQRQSGDYSIISPLSNKLYQVTYNDKELAYHITNITDPAAPVRSTKHDERLMDSLKTLLSEHFLLQIPPGVR